MKVTTAPTRSVKVSAKAPSANGGTRRSESGPRDNFRRSSVSGWSPAIALKSFKDGFKSKNPALRFWRGAAGGAAAATAGCLALTGTITPIGAVVIISAAAAGGVWNRNAQEADFSLFNQPIACDPFQPLTSF